MNSIKPHLSTLFAMTTLIAMGFWFHTCEMKRNQENSLRSVIAEKNSEMKLRRTKDSLTIAEKEKAQLTSFNEALRYYGDDIALLKKQGEYSNSEIKALKSFIKVGFESITSGVSPTTIHNYYDSGKWVEARSASFRDNHFRIHANMLPTRTLWDTVQYRATFTAAGFQRTKWFKTRTYVNAFLDDKNASITNMSNFELKEIKDKRFGIGPAIVYDPFNNRIVPGIGVHYSLIKF